MDLVLGQFLAGLSYGSTLFLVSADLTLIFGGTRVVNFAHGSLFMLGMYLAVALAPAVGFWLAVPLAALAVGAFGAAAEAFLKKHVFTRVARLDDRYSSCKRAISEAYAAQAGLSKPALR